jgi:hypothetical protein
MALVRRMVSRTVRTLAPWIPPLSAALAELDKYRQLQQQLQHLEGVAKENVRLHHENAQIRVLRYGCSRFMWQLRALQVEHFGRPNPCPVPPKKIPPELLPGFSMNGRAEIEYSYLNCTYPDNHPLIYTDR